MAPTRRQSIRKGFHRVEALERRVMLAVLTTAEIGEWDGFLDGGIANLPAMEAAGANEAAPFDHIQGDDAFADAEFEFTLATTPFGQDLGEFAFTIGLADHDTARAGIQLAEFTIDGANFTGVMNQAFESHGGEQAVYNVYNVVLPPAAGARVADGNAVFRFKFEGGGLSGGPRDSTTPSRFNGMSVDFARVAPRCAINLLPYRLEGDFTHNAALDRCEATGPVIIRNGTAPALHVSGGMVWVAEGRIEATGTFSMMVDGVMKNVFTGTAGEGLESTPNYNTWMVLTQPVDVLLPPEDRPAGLPVKISDLKFAGAPGKIRVDGAFFVSEIGGVRLPSPAFELGATGLTLGALGTQLPDIDATLFGALQIRTFGLQAGYSPQSNQLRLEGRFTIKSLIGGGGPSLTATLAPGTGIVIDASGVDFSGSLSVADLTIVPGLFKLKELTVNAEVVDSTLISIGGLAKVELARGIVVGGEFQIINGELDRVKLFGEKLKIPIGSTGLMLQRVNAFVSGLATGGADPSFGGGVGFSFGPEYTINLPAAFGGSFNNVSLLSIDLSATATLNFFDFENSEAALQASATVVLLGGVATGTGTIRMDFQRVELTIDTTFKALGGFIEAQSHFMANASLNLSASATASLKIPPTVPLIGGTELLGGRMLFNYRHNDTLADDYIAGYADITTWFGTFRTGARVNFDGTAQVLGLVPLSEATPGGPLGPGPGPTPLSRSFTVPAGRRFVVLSAYWANAAAAGVPIRVRAPDGQVYTPANFGTAVDYIDEFTSTKRVTVAINAPMAGTWTLELTDPSALGAVTFEGFYGAVEPTISLTAPAGAVPGGVVPITYQSTFANAGTTVSLFYDTDGQGFDGQLIASDLPAGNSTYTWDTSGVEPGPYRVYAQITDHVTAVPVSQYAAGIVGVGDEAPRPLGPQSRVEGATWPTGHDVAADAAGNFVVVWVGMADDIEAWRVFARRFSADGTPLGPRFLVSDDRTAGLGTAVAMTAAGDFVIAWEAAGATGPIIVARRFDAQGQPLGDALTVSGAQSARQLDIGINADGEFAVAWVAEFVDDQGNALGSHVMLRRYNAAGGSLGEAAQVTTMLGGAERGGKFHPRVAAADDSWVVAWRAQELEFGDDIVQARIYETDGAPRTGEVLVFSESSGPDSLHRLGTPVVDAAAEGRFIVAWATENDGTYTLEWQRFDADGVATGDKVELPHHRYPDVLMTRGGDVLIAGEQSFGGVVQARRYDGNGNALTPQFALSTFAADDSRPVLADGVAGGFVATWRSSDSPDLYIRLFGAPAFVSAPRVTSALFVYDPRQELRITFDKDVRDSVELADLVVTDLSTGLRVPAAGFELELSGDPLRPTTATWRRLTPLPDGNYRATLAGGVVRDAYGNALAAPGFSMDFAILAGDADGDDRISIADFFAVNRGRALRLTGFANGDFNYSGGRADADDQMIIDRAFLRQQAPAGAPLSFGVAPIEQENPAPSEPVWGGEPALLG